MRRTLIALGTALVLAACGGGNGGGTGTTAEPSASTGPGGETATAVTSVDGTWAAAGLTEEDAAAAIQAQGFGDKETAAFWADMAAQESLDLTLKLQDGQLTLFGAADGADPGILDRGTFSVDGDTLTFTYLSGGTSTLRWTVEGDRLTLDLLEDDQGDFEGTPTEVFVAGLYTSSPFERTSG